jgi:hypothetical protein
VAVEGLPIVLDPILLTRVVDLGPDWTRIQRLYGSGSVLGIRIPDPEPGARKLRNISGKMHFLVIFFLILPLKKYKIALSTF